MGWRPVCLLWSITNNIYRGRESDCAAHGQATYLHCDQWTERIHAEAALGDAVKVRRVCSAPGPRVPIQSPGIMRLEFSGPFVESLNGKCQSFPGERSRKLQTHRSRGSSFCSPLYIPSVILDTKQPGGRGACGGVKLTAPPVARPLRDLPHRRALDLGHVSDDAVFSTAAQPPYILLKMTSLGPPRSLRASY